MSMASTVLPFSQSKRPSAKQAPRMPQSANGGAPAVAGELLWRVADLPTTEETRPWLDAQVGGTVYENLAKSLWTHHPNLLRSTEKLAGFIPPTWPDQAGEGSLLAQAVAAALTRVHGAVSQGQRYEGRLIGLYLFGLLSVHEQVGSFVVRGQDSDGQVRVWDYFSAPLREWALGHGIDTLVLTPTDSVRSEFVTGLYHHMIASITSPVDAGHLTTHAARG